MGRGRAKAKQTKVARELKYHSTDTDFEALQRELSGNGRSNGRASANDDDDPYAAYLDDTDEDDDNDEAADGARSSRR